MLLLAAVALACHARVPAAAPASQPRVVSLHDVTTEIVVALGARDRLVGVGGPVQLPEEVQRAVAGVARVDGAESILAARPTVVLGMAVVAERSPELVRFLREQGIEVWLGHPTTASDLLALVTEIGARVGAAPAAATLTARLAPSLTPVERGAAVRVFVYDCCDPPFTAGRTAVLTDLIERAGGRNVFADLAADWTKVSWEEVIARRPELIVIHDYQYGDQGGVEEKRRRLRAFPSLGSIPVTVMPLGFSLGGLRSVAGLEHLRRALAARRRAG